MGVNYQFRSISVTSNDGRNGLDLDVAEGIADDDFRPLVGAKRDAHVNHIHRQTCLVGTGVGCLLIERYAAEQGQIDLRIWGHIHRNGNAQDLQIAKRRPSGTELEYAVTV